MGQLKMLYEEVERGNCEWDKFATVVEPVIDNSVRRLCVKEYRGHPKGCPNFGKRPTCPPQAPLLWKVLDLDKPVFCIWNRFDFGTHVDKMREMHPDWSQHQLRNCLYWQGTARKQLRGRIAKLVKLLDFDPVVLTCPEACGVNVTETVRSLGLELEWPPEEYAYQVALVGHPLKTGDRHGE